MEELDRKKKELSTPAPPPFSPPRSNLPTQQYFFGRTKELTTIAEAISHDARTWGALIDGPGGIGKTALAIRAGHDAPAQDFERKIFLSAKVRELTPAGEQPLDDFSLRDYLSLLAELARELDAEDAARAEPEERVKAVHRALNGQRILLVIDNVETFPEDERVRLYQFLSRLPGGCKAVVTSRRRTDIDARVIRLDRLERQEALGLLNALAKHNRHLRHATDEEWEMLYGVTNGNPLLLRWTASQLGRPESRCRTIAEACAFLEKAPQSQGHNDPLEYVFGDLLETFTPNETAVLAALAHFTHPAPVEQVAAVAGTAEQAARTALEDLNDRALLVGDEEGEKFLLPKLAANFIRRKRPEQVEESRYRLSDHAFALIIKNGYEKYDRFSVLEKEWPLISASLPLFTQGTNNQLQEICNALSNFLSFSGRWDDWLSISQQVEKKAVTTEDKHAAAIQLYQAGCIYYQRGQAAQVLTCATTCTDYWADAEASQKAYAIRLHGLFYRLIKNYPAAVTACKKALNLWQTIASESIEVAIGLNDLSEIQQLKGNIGAAERDCKEALLIANKINDREGIAIYTGNLAGLALDRKDWPQAEELALQALILAEEVGRRELIGGSSRVIAQAMARQGKTEEGLGYAQRAVEISTDLRQPDELKKAQAALQECGGGL